MTKVLFLILSLALVINCQTCTKVGESCLNANQQPGFCASLNDTLFCQVCNLETCRPESGCKSASCDTSGRCIQTPKADFTACGTLSERVCYTGDCVDPCSTWTPLNDGCGVNANDPMANTRQCFLCNGTCSSFQCSNTTTCTSTTCVPHFPCQEATCEAATGVCNRVNKTATSPCTTSNGVTGVCNKEGLCLFCDTTSCVPRVPCEKATCDTVNGVCIRTALTNMEVCQTANFTGVCSAGVCLEKCSDKNCIPTSPCNEAACDTTTNKCVITKKAFNSPCQTTAFSGFCSDTGVCNPPTTTCTPNTCVSSPCEIAQCDAVTNACVRTKKSNNDVCSGIDFTGHCMEGACVPNNSVPTPSPVPSPNTACPTLCTTDKPCTVASCVNGACALTAAADGNDCTVNGGAGKCRAGLCYPSSSTGCTATLCVAKGSCDWAKCNETACVRGLYAAGTSCINADGAPGVCREGVCVVPTIPTCPSACVSENPCHEGYCDNTGNCQVRVKLAGALCAVNGQQGRCTSTATCEVSTTCDATLCPAKVCKVSSCSNTATGCQYSPVSSGNTCFMNGVAGTCNADGVCVLNPCSLDKCPAKPCTKPISCDPTTAECKYTFTPGLRCELPATAAGGVAAVGVCTETRACQVSDPSVCIVAGQACVNKDTNVAGLCAVDSTTNTLDCKSCSADTCVSHDQCIEASCSTSGQCVRTSRTPKTTCAYAGPNGEAMKGVCFNFLCVDPCSLYAPTSNTVTATCQPKTLDVPPTNCRICGSDYRCSSSCTCQCVSSDPCKPYTSCLADGTCSPAAPIEDNIRRECKTSTGIIGVCVAGACQATNVTISTCTVGTECTVPGSNSPGKCVALSTSSTPVCLPSADPCSTIAAPVQCSTAAVPNGFCKPTTADQFVCSACNADTCSFTFDGCFKGVCQNGVCARAPVADGSPCKSATGAGVCVAGVCTGNVDICDSAKPLVSTTTGFGGCVVPAASSPTGTELKTTCVVCGDAKDRCCAGNCTCAPVECKTTVCQNGQCFYLPVDDSLNQRCSTGVCLGGVCQDLCLRTECKQPASPCAVAVCVKDATGAPSCIEKPLSGAAISCTVDNHAGVCSEGVCKPLTTNPSCTNCHPLAQTCTANGCALNAGWSVSASGSFSCDCSVALKEKPSFQCFDGTQQTYTCNPQRCAWEPVPCTVPQCTLQQNEICSTTANVFSVGCGVKPALDNCAMPETDPCVYKCMVNLAARYCTYFKDTNGLWSSGCSFDYAGLGVSTYAEFTAKLRASCPACQTTVPVTTDPCRNFKTCRECFSSTTNKCAWLQGKVSASGAVASFVPSCASVDVQEKEARIRGISDDPLSFVTSVEHCFVPTTADGITDGTTSTNNVDFSKLADANTLNAVVASKIGGTVATCNVQPLKGFFLAVLVVLQPSTNANKETSVSVKLSLTSFDGTAVDQTVKDAVCCVMKETVASSLGVPSTVWKSACSVEQETTTVKRSSSSGNYVATMQTNAGAFSSTPSDASVTFVSFFVVVAMTLFALLL